MTSSLYILLLIYLGWSLVAKKTKCNGEEEDGGEQENINDCSTLCKKTSSIFAYGRHGNKRCNGTTCSCWCQLDAFDGQCTKGQRTAGLFDLYRIQPGTGVFLIGFDVDTFFPLKFGPL